MSLALSSEMGLTEDIDSQERASLLAKLQELVEENGWVDAIVESWAALWLADIEVLREIVTWNPVAATMTPQGVFMDMDFVRICKLSV
jgi:hypothetical protein